MRAGSRWRLRVVLPTPLSFASNFLPISTSSNPPSVTVAAPRGSGEWPDFDTSPCFTDVLRRTRDRLRDQILTRYVAHLERSASPSLPPSTTLVTAANMSDGQRQHVNQTASATAHTAATQAFLANRQSTPNLSASAAAAALRTMSPPPTDVSQVQTRRTLQRQNSNSSTGSAGRGRPGGLHRSGSNGSMTERTFRTPSPHRPGSRGGAEWTPPVPQLPQSYTAVPTKTHRRAASMEPLQAPPPRYMSPPVRPAGRGQSLDRGPAAVKQRPTAAKKTKLKDINELDRTDSQNSINFSYPRNARPNSPPVRPPAAASHEAHHFPKSMRSGVSPDAAQYDLSRTADAPVKKTKKKSAAVGSHFRSASAEVRPTAPTTAPAPTPVTAPAPTTATASKVVAAEPVVDEPIVEEPVERAEQPFETAEESQVQSDNAVPRYSSDEDSTPEKSGDRQRRSQRASGALNKQPSVVREDWEGEQNGQSTPAISGPTSVQRMGEQLSPVDSPMISPIAPQSKKSQTAANISRKFDDGSSASKAAAAAPAQVHDAVTLPQKPMTSAQHLAATEAPVVRTASLSPSRSTRFSDHLSSDLAAGRKHEPLRSVSPAKSAMKAQSPSPMPASPIDGQFGPRARGSSQTPSEASETNSLMSADGLGPAARKKKSARVSFEPETAVIGTAAVVEPPTPTYSSPSGRENSKKGWFGLGKSKPSGLGTIPAEDDIEEVMAPRPALPSFGSIRGKGRNAETYTTSTRSPPQPRTPSGNAIPTQVALSTPSVSSETWGSSTMQALDNSVSSDHAIGGILAQQALRSKPATTNTSISSEPLPPEVTSVEGTGYVSDSENSDVDEVPQTSRVGQDPADPVEEPTVLLPTATNVAPTEPGTAQEATSRAETSAAIPSAVDATATSAAATVPSITVQPATPALRQSPAQDPYSIAVPGSFPASTSNLPSPELTPAVETAGLGFAAPQPLSQALLEQHAGPDAQERDSDHDSIYSDAAESQAGLDGDGFGSINAIVDSPVVATPVARSDQAPESPLEQTSSSRSRPAVDNRTASWENAQAHWSGLAQSYRQGISPPLAQQDEYRQQPAASKSKRQKATVAAAAAAARNTSPQAPDQRTASPRIADRPRTAGQAKSLAPSPNFQPAPALAGGPPKQRGTLQKKHLPTGAVPTSGARQAAAGSKPMSSPPRPSRLQRTMSNDSDSSSSFRPRRRAESGEGKFFNRRSMRTGAAAEAPVAAMAMAQRSTSTGKPMRASMRGSIDSGPPSRREQYDATRSSSLFGRSKQKTKSPARAPAPKMKSRFSADSDDEGASVPAIFKSRFEDSSDEEKGLKKFTPVRGIPRKQNEGDSTDLEDSSDEEGKRPSAPLRIDTATKETSRPETPTTPVSPYSERKRRSLFSRFRSRKEKAPDDRSRLGVGTIAERDSLLEQTRPDLEAAQQAQIHSSPKAQTKKPRSSRLGFGSLAERDAMIERTRAKLEEAREGQDQVEDMPPTANGQKPRRAQPERVMSDSWPLPPKIAGRERPNTSDGIRLSAVASDTNLRSTIASRGKMSTPSGAVGPNAVYGRTGRKKRFPWLRKAFGLVD